MGAHELRERVEEESLSNPALETGEFESGSPYGGARSEGGGFDAALAVADDGGDTLYEHIREQLLSLSIEKPLLKAADFAAQNLDENGYLTESAAALASALDAPEPLMARAAELIRSLEPAGVGARNLGDCLALQLRRFHRDEDTALAETIATSYLEKVARGQLGYISGELHCSEREVREAVRRIRTLNPRPCAVFAKPDKPRYIIPDIIVEYAGGVLSVKISDSYLPPLTVSERMTELLTSTGDEELAAYVRDRVNAAKWLIGSLGRRRDTLLKCATEIVSRQSAFFTGQSGTLAPLTMSELAESMGVSVSTVSRAVRDKYVKCGKGIFTMRWFITGASTAGGEYSRNAAKSLVADLTAGEDKNRPLSDMAIAGLLAERGCELSRRTVAKYRAELGIPPASARKNYS